MTIILEQHEVPETGTFEIHRSVTIRVSAELARRQVNRWLLESVSYMLGAADPTLVVGDRAVWRVPVVLTAPQVGFVDMVGTVDVDVETGDLLEQVMRREEILQQARKASAALPPYGPRVAQDLPTEYIARNIQPTRIEPSRKPDEIIDSTRHRTSLQ